MSVLSAAEIEAYRRDGLVAPLFRLTQGTLERMRTWLKPQLPEDEGAGPDFVPDLMADGFGVEFGRTPEILHAVSQLIGPNFVLWACGMFGKPAQRGKPTPWHQDGAYWPIEPLATCTVWIALDASTQDNGCLRFVPGSHLLGKVLPHKPCHSDQFVLNRGLADPTVWESRAHDVVLEPGQVSIHDVLLLHSSRANRSGRRRAGVTFRYMPTTSRYNRATARKMHCELGVPDISGRILYLVSGEDKHGGNDVTVP